MTCIFCKQEATGSSTSHILPVALGGDKWACLQDGLVCSKCNQYFGEKVEGPSLNSFPLLAFRVLLGIPTRKKKFPIEKTQIGNITAHSIPGVIEFDPVTELINRKILDGEITSFRILAEPSQPIAICRMLVKMGLEVVAQDSPSDARSSLFDSARIFARNPIKGTPWWFLIHTNHSLLFSRFTKGITYREWVHGVELSVSQHKNYEIFRLQLLDMTLITPLHDFVRPPEMEEFPEPDYRLFCVKI